MSLVMGVCAALFDRARGGAPGRIVETSLFRTGIYCNGWGIQEALLGNPQTVPEFSIENAIKIMDSAVDFLGFRFESQELWGNQVRSPALPRHGTSLDSRPLNRTTNYNINATLSRFFY